MEEDYNTTSNGKSFILSGDTFVDIQGIVAFRFENDPEGYIRAIYQTYDSPDIGIYTNIANKNELSHLFLQLEKYFDNPLLGTQLSPLINKIDMERMKAEIIEEVKPKKPRKPKKKE